MKKLLIAAAALGTLGIAACGGEEKAEDAADDKGTEDTSASE